MNDDMSYLMHESWALPYPIQNTTPQNPATWLLEYFGGRPSDSGVTVSNNTALTYSTIWNAVTMIAGDISGVPANFYRRTGDGRLPDDQYQGSWLLNGQANMDMTGRQVRETLQAHALLWGNGYAYISRTNGMVPQALVPMLPDCMTVSKEMGQPLIYEYTDTFGRTSTYAPEEILHIKGLGWDGLTGYSVLSMARNSFGLGLAEEKHGSGHFRNGARPDIVIRLPHDPGQQKADKLLADWESRHRGAANTGRPALATGGMEVIPLPISNADSQWIASREFQREEIAAWFRVPLSRLGSDKHTSYNSLEVQERVYYNMTLRYWFNVWEDECQAKFLRENDRLQRRVFIEHNVSKLFEADTKTKTEWLAKQIESLMRTPNEARKEINLPPIEGGDELKNPNTTSGGGQRQDDEPEEEGDDETSRNYRASLHDFICESFGGINKREREKVLAAARKQKNFVGWLDHFYSEQWPYNLEQGLKPICKLIASTTTCNTTPQRAAQELAKQAKAAIMDVTNYSYDDSLVANIEDFMEDWPEMRAQATANILLGEQT